MEGTEKRKRRERGGTVPCPIGHLNRSNNWWSLKTIKKHEVKSFTKNFFHALHNPFAMKKKKIKTEEQQQAVETVWIAKKKSRLRHSCTGFKCNIWWTLKKPIFSHSWDECYYVVLLLFIVRSVVRQWAVSSIFMDSETDFFFFLPIKRIYLHRRRKQMEDENWE